MEQRRTDWTYLGREAFLVVVFAYVLVAGGTFTGLIQYRLRLISAVLSVAVFGAWLLWRLFQRQRLPRTGLEAAWLLFIGAQVLAIIFSDDPRRSLPVGLLWVTYALIFYLAYDLLRRGWAAELLEKALLIAGAVVIIMAWVDLAGAWAYWRTSTQGLALVPSFGVRISGVVGDPNLLAATVNLLLPLALTRALASRNRLTQIVLGAFWLAGAVALYFTDSRGGLLGLGMGLAVVAFGWVRLLNDRARDLYDRAWGWLREHRLLLYGGFVLVIVLGILVAGRVLGGEGDTTHAPVASARDIYWQSAAAAFRAQPLTGVGPGLFPVYLMQLWSTPPARPYLHAHSTPFNFGAETGLLGFAALFILLWAIFKGGRWAWQGQDLPGRARWLGAGAALAGFSLHSLVDHFLPFPLVGLILMLLVALWLAPGAGEEPEEQAAFSPLWLLVPGLAVMLLGANGLRAGGQAAAAVDAYESGELLAAAKGMEGAAALDPSFAFYWQQAAYAYGVLAAESPAYADLAAVAYQRGIEGEPVYSLNYANLGALYADEGLDFEALTAFEDGVGRAPEDAQFWLNLGALQERMEDLADASESYQHALALAPEIADAAFWTRTDFRSDVLADYEPASPEVETRRQESERLVAQGRAAIAAGDLSSGEELLAQAHRLNDQEVRLYVGLAQLALARGDLDLANQYLDAGLGILSTRNDGKVEAILLQAEILDQQGDAEGALQRYQIAYDAILSRNVYGWGAYGWTPYSLFVFYREGFPEDLLPQLERVDIPISIAQRLLRLAEVYAANGQAAQAAEVRAALQPYLP